MRAQTSYLSPARPRIFAHRGFTVAADGSAIDENTIPAFKRAVQLASEQAFESVYLETDLQCTKDGFAVVFHDSDLARCSPTTVLENGKAARIEDLTLQQIREVKLPNGGSIPTLDELLAALPTARFNIDFKSWNVVQPGLAELKKTDALDRVLISAFSEKRRTAMLRSVDQPVATSAGSGLVIATWLAHKLQFRFLVANRLRDVNALQIPVASGGLRFGTSSFVKFVQSFGVEVHFWTINDPSEMRRMLELGADGIVTDRLDEALAVIRG